MNSNNLLWALRLIIIGGAALRGLPIFLRKLNESSLHPMEFKVPAFLVPKLKISEEPVTEILYSKKESTDRNIKWGILLLLGLILTFIFLTFARVKKIYIRRETYFRDYPGQNFKIFPDLAWDDTFVVISAQLESLEIGDDFMIHGYDSVENEFGVRYPRGNHMKNVEWVKISKDGTSRNMQSVCLTYPIVVVLKEHGNNFSKCVTTVTKVGMGLKFGKWIL